MFSREAEMKYPVRCWMIQQGMYVAEEFSTGWGICDLVGCKFDENKITQRTQQKQRQPIGSTEAVYIYNQLPDSAKSKRGVRLETLANKLGPYIKLDKIESTINRLKSTNHVIETKSGSYQKVNGWAPLYSRLVAIELKLNRLSDVINQARANQAIVPESYIALPADVAEQNFQKEFRSLLENEGLGLLAVTEDSCNMLLRARQTSGLMFTALELWVVENFWRIYRGKH